MSRYDDEDERHKSQFYGSSVQKGDGSKSGDKIGGSAGSDSSNRDKSNTENDSDTGNNDSADTENSDEKDTENNAEGCKTWLEVLPSKGGILLAALLAEVMTEGLTPTQMNILGSFIGSVGTLIAYKAARDALDFPLEPF